MCKFLKSHRDRWVGVPGKKRWKRERPRAFPGSTTRRVSAYFDRLPYARSAGKGSLLAGHINQGFITKGKGRRVIGRQLTGIVPIRYSDC